MQKQNLWHSMLYETWVELEHKDDETATKQRKEMYKKAVKHASRQLDALYL